jgi:hypothetical protein
MVCSKCRNGVIQPLEIPKETEFSILKVFKSAKQLKKKAAAEEEEEEEEIQVTLTLAISSALIRTNSFLL